MAARRRRKLPKQMIKPSHKGLFTKKAKAAGMSVQGYAGRVLAAPKGKYPAATRRQAVFAKNFGGASRRRARRG